MAASPLLSAPAFTQELATNIQREIEATIQAWTRGLEATLSCFYEAQVVPLATEPPSQPYSDEELALMDRQLAEIELPPELDRWFRQFVGGLKTSLEFDSRTDVDRDETAHVDDD